MKVLVLHNRYIHAGGEDTVFESETRMLEAAGHTVLRYEVSNDMIEGMDPATVAIKSVWNRATNKEIRDIIRRRRPDVAHFHNTTPLISPAAYWACQSEGVPVVQTLHNYRLACLSALLYRDNAICEQCLGRNLLRGVYHRCYRHSFNASLALATTIHFHRLAKTYRDKVDIYIALTEFGKAKMVEAGLSAEKIFVKPNALEVPASMATCKRSATALFAGRLSYEKGLDILLDAWKRAKLPPEARLLIAGDGPERERLQKLAADTSNICFAGKLSKNDLREVMRSAGVSILPSVCYEGFPMAVAEGFTLGLPTIVSDIGGQAALVRDGETGFYFRSGDAASLAGVLERAFADPERLAAMGRAAYECIAASDSPPERNVDRLLAIYETAIVRASEARRHLAPIAWYRKTAARLTTWITWSYQKFCTMRQPAQIRRTTGDEGKIVLFEPYGMGDMITMLPLLKRLREAGRDTIVIGKEAWREIVPESDYADWIPVSLDWTSSSSREKYHDPLQLFHDSLEITRTYRERCRGTIAFDPRGDTRSILFLSLLRCARIVSLDHYLGSDLSTSSLAAETISTLRNVPRWQVAGEFCRVLGIEPPTEPPTMARLTAPTPSKRIGLVTVAPWKGKNWPAENWQALAQALCKNGWEPTSLCGPQQRDEAQQNTPDTPVLVAESIHDWRALLESCAAIVTLDTGPMHLADAIGVPLVALFGSTVLPLWAPPRKTSIAIDASGRTPGMPCHQIDAHLHAAQCAMATITVEEVLEKIEFLDKSLYSQ